MLKRTNKNVTEFSRRIKNAEFYAKVNSFEKIADSSSKYSY
jgi:hypothetical protein